MNTMKTKVIWIGRKIFSKDKLKVNTTFEWGTTEFNLLGLEFNVDLDKMVQKNYLNAIAQSKLILNNWKKRHLTPFGKVTFYCVNTSYPMDNSLSGRRGPARQTSEKDVLCLHRLGRPSTVH